MKAEQHCLIRTAPLHPLYASASSSGIVGIVVYKFYVVRTLIEFIRLLSKQEN